MNNQLPFITKTKPMPSNYKIQIGKLWKVPHIKIWWPHHWINLSHLSKHSRTFPIPRHRKPNLSSNIKSHCITKIPIQNIVQAHKMKFSPQEHSKLIEIWQIKKAEIIHSHQKAKEQQQNLNSKDKNKEYRDNILNISLKWPSFTFLLSEST